MKKNYILAFLLISVSVFSAAQAPPAIQWEKSLGGSGSEANFIDFDRTIAPTSDGGYIAVTTTTSNDVIESGYHGGYDGWVVKLDGNGTLQWQKCLGGSGDDGMNAVAQTSDGGYILAGFSSSSDADVTSNKGASDVWIIKLSTNGILQWQKNYGGSQGEFASSIEQTTDGGYIVAGTTSSDDGDVSGYHGGEDYWVIKIDAAGSLQWQKCLGGSDFAFLGDNAFSVQQTADAGYIVVGLSTSSDGDVTGHHGDNLPDCWVVKLDGTGSLQWQRSIGGTLYDEGYSVLQTSDGGYLIAGNAGSSDGDLSGVISPGHSDDAWVIKLNSDGTIKWQKTYGGSNSDVAYAIRRTSDNGYIVAGNSGSNDGDVTGNHGSADVWLFKIDSIGTLQWQKCLGGSDIDGAYAVYPTTDKGYIIASHTWSDDGDISNNHGEDDLWVVKLQPDALLPVTGAVLSGKVKSKQNLLYWSTLTEHDNIGFEIQRSIDGYIFNKVGFVKTKAKNGSSDIKLDYEFVDISFTSSGNYYRLKQIDDEGKFTYSNIISLKNESSPANGSFSLHPNPVKNILNIKLVSFEKSNIKLTISDMEKKIILVKNYFIENSEKNIQLNISPLAAGTYIIKITNTDGSKKWVSKFIKE